APADALSAGAFGDVDAVFDNSLVAAATGDGAHGGPADDLAVPKRDEAMFGEMGRVPRLPGRHLGLEGRVPGRDALRVHAGDAGPVLGPESLDHGRRRTDRHQQQPARAAGLTTGRPFAVGSVVLTALMIAP